MRILVITRNAWDDTNSIGNTLSNFFGGMEDVEFANIYFRSASPNNNLCKKYYRATETEILKKWFTPKKIGKSFALYNSEKKEVTDTVAKNEKALVSYIRDYGLKAAYKLSDALWYSKKWINGNLEEFIRSFSPDLMFTFVKASPQYYLTVKYLKEKFRVPLLTWIADDEYSGYFKNSSNKEISNLKYIIDVSDVIYGCSEKICGYYNSVFGCHADPLYKGCDFSVAVKKYTNDPIKVVYAGNLLYGRLEIIKRISEIFEKYPKDGQKVSFDIYSNTSLSSGEREFFDKKKCSDYKGCRDYETIKQKLSEADVVLHTESFDEEQIIKTKYSFSTKIIDCLQSGSVLLAIGPEEIASMEYIKKIPGSCVIDDLNSMEEKIISFMEDSASFPKKALSSRKFAEKYHDSVCNTQKMKETIKNIIGE